MQEYLISGEPFLAGPRAPGYWEHPQAIAFSVSQSQSLLLLPHVSFLCQTSLVFFWSSFFSFLPCSPALHHSLYLHPASSRFLAFPAFLPHCPFHRFAPGSHFLPPLLCILASTKPAEKHPSSLCQCQTPPCSAEAITGNVSVQSLHQLARAEHAPALGTWIPPKSCGCCQWGRRWIYHHPGRAAGNGGTTQGAVAAISWQEASLTHLMLLPCLPCYPTSVFCFSPFLTPLLLYLTRQVF